jgi:D-alanine--poly(phosphoribitol) ligase subunit 2
MQEQIMLILSRACGAEPGELESGIDLFESGLLDSFGVVQLLVELEEKLGIALDIEQLSRDEVATPAQIIALAEKAS